MSDILLQIAHANTSLSLQIASLDCFLLKPLTEALRVWGSGEAEVVWEHCALAECHCVTEESGANFPDNLYVCVSVLKVRQ